jgi:hypothetical protein
MALFEAIKYVGSGLTLVAFIVAAIAWAYRSSLTSRKQTIELAPAEERPALIERTLKEFFVVDTGNLTAEQKYNLAIRQIHARSSRFRIGVWTSLAVTCAAGVFTVIFLMVNRLPAPPVPSNGSPSNGNSSNGVGGSSNGDHDPRHIALVKVEGDGVIFSTLAFKSFVVKAIDENGNPAPGVKIVWSTPIGGDKAYVDVTVNDGRSSATNLYSFPTPGLYEQIAAVAAPDAQIGWGSISSVKVVGPAVKFAFHLQPEVGNACADGQYKEGNSMTWSLSHTPDGLALRRTDGACWAALVADGVNWKGTLQCNNNSSYPVVLMPNEGCTELPSSISWFKLNK